MNTPDPTLFTDPDIPESFRQATREVMAGHLEDGILPPAKGPKWLLILAVLVPLAFGNMLPRTSLLMGALLALAGAVGTRKQNSKLTGA